MANSTRVIRSNNAELPMTTNAAMHWTANTFRLIHAAKQRENQGEVNELKITLLRIIRTYKIRDIASNAPHDLSTLIYMIDDLERDRPPNHARVGRIPNNTPPDPITAICHALFALNPAAWELTKLYVSLFDQGHSKLANFRPPPISMINANRAALSAKAEPVKMLINGVEKDFAAKAYGQYAAHRHHETGQQYCQLASCPQEIYSSPLYAFHAQAWAMRTYAGLLKEHGRSSCPFMKDVLERTPIGEPTVQQLLYENVGPQIYLRPYILCYQRILSYHPSVHSRSNHSFVLPYFGRNERGDMVLYKTHLHHPQYSKSPRDDGSVKLQRYSRLHDVIAILSHELQAVGFPDLRQFADRFHLPAINTSKINVDEAHAQYVEEQFDKHRNAERTKQDTSERLRQEEAQRMIDAALDKLAGQKS